MTPLLHPGARLVVAASGQEHTGIELHRRASSAAEAYALDAARRRARGEPVGVVLALTPIDAHAVVVYLGALAAGRPLALLDPRLSRPVLLDLIDRYAPALITGVDGAPGADGGPPGGYRATDLPGLGPVWSRTAGGGVEPHPELALLLGTSGSTGSPKLVRLSATAVLANAASIADSLDIGDDEVAATTLPLFYTYGLSVLNSHLLRGATVVLEDSALLRGEFWRAVHDHKVTSLAAVPYQYAMLRRLCFDPAEYPAVRTLTQAGGRLPVELVRDFAARMSTVDGRLYVMYGQTEATARMTVLPPARLADKLGSAGLPVPGGRLSVRTGDQETSAAGVSGEVVYRGPNVMMGYADDAADLARPDELAGVLHTGDLGHLDEDGFLFLTGRTKRIAKVFGVRVNLDDVERRLAEHGPVAAVAGDDRIHVFLEGAGADLTRAVRSDLATWLDSHVSGVDVRAVDTLPLLPTGKIDYRALEARR